MSDHELDDRVKVITDKADAGLSHMPRFDAESEGTQLRAAQAENKRLQEKLRVAQDASVPSGARRSSTKAKRVSVHPRSAESPKSSLVARTHGLNLAARRVAMNKHRCFFCGSEHHIFADCDATEQACPLCLSTDHHANDCSVLAEATGPKNA
jgi:hypothetical protein